MLCFVWSPYKAPLPPAVLSIDTPNCCHIKHTLSSTFQPFSPSPESLPSSSQQQSSSWHETLFIFLEILNGSSVPDRHWTHVMLVFTRCLCPSVPTPHCPVPVIIIVISVSDIIVSLWGIVITFIQSTASKQWQQSLSAQYKLSGMPLSPCAPLAHWRLH